MSLELTIDLDFLDKINPPSSFPPNQDELNVQLQQRFLSQCERFISNQRMLYKCSKAIENRLSRVWHSSIDIEQKMSSEKDKLDYIAHQLRKYKQQQQILKEREKILRMFCQLIKMEEIRKELLLGDYKKQILESQQKPIIVNEQQYLSKLQKLCGIIKQSQSISQFKKQFPLVEEVLEELQNIFKSALKFIIKRLLTPKMVELIITEYYSLFSLSENDNQMRQAIISNRLNHLKISLNPMINNLNYATNVPQLYESILSSWIKLLLDEFKLFQKCQQYSLLRTIHKMLMIQLLPKIEKNIFKIKQFVSIVKIRKSYNDFAKSLLKIKQLDKPGVDWQVIQSALNKCQIIVATKLSEESQALQTSKYNIYSMTSYIPIRQHLQKIKVCYENSAEDEKIDWEVGFYNLCSSRDPKNYPNNKSLVIFNLNIWYLYLKLINNGKHREEGEEIMKWSLNTLTNINVQETARKFYDTFDKVLELCGNIPAFKAVLYAQISLLGHQQLRKDMARTIKKKYIEIYQQNLRKIQKNPMTNEQVKAFCNEKKINLNKFGKHSHSICVYSPQALEQLLEF